jgi:hypothetical protein
MTVISLNFHSRIDFYLLILNSICRSRFPKRETAKCSRKVEHGLFTRLSSRAGSRSNSEAPTQCSRHCKTVMTMDFHLLIVFELSLWCPKNHIDLIFFIFTGIQAVSTDEQRTANSCKS